VYIMYNFFLFEDGMQITVSNACFVMDDGEGASAWMPPITVTAQGPPVSSAAKFLIQTAPTFKSPPKDTPLLRAVKTALRGSDTEDVSTIQTAHFFTGKSLKDPELTWNAYDAVLSYEGVMVKRWSFNREGEAIQWACIASLEQFHSNLSATTAVNYARADDSPVPTAKVTLGPPTFGPFRSQAQTNKKPEAPPEIVQGIFIFFRSTGNIYLLNGNNYVFSVPFIVRRAWPASPHGVLIQRVLEPSEIVDAEQSGDDVLPTLFSLTSPLTEANVVGLASGIVGPTNDTPATLKNNEDTSTKPLVSIPATEMAVWVSHSSIISDCRIVITVNIEKRLLSIWRYVYIKPKDTPTSIRVKATKPSTTSKRRSMSGVGSRRTSALFDDRRERNHHPMSPSARSREPILTPDLFDLGDIPALSSFPGMASSIPTTTTMSSLVSGGPSSQRQIPVTKGRRNSLSRNDLSMTMDRMALGGRMDPEGGYYPLEYGRMRAAYWMECLLTHQIPEEEYVPNLSRCSHVNPSLGSVPVIGVKYRCLYSTTVSMASSLVASFPSVSL